MKVKTRFLSVRSEDVSGVGENEQGSLFVVFKSGATHHVKYDDHAECKRDRKAIDDAMDSDDGPKFVEPADE